MIQKKWDDILRLLAIAVLADDQLRPTEIAAFCHETQSLIRKIGASDIRARSDFKTWLLTHKDSIETQLNSSERDHFIQDAVQSITDAALRPAILSSLFRLSVSDSDLHTKEVDLLTICKSQWNVPISNLTIT